jgi:hypothetical protein
MDGAKALLNMHDNHPPDIVMVGAKALLHNMRGDQSSTNYVREKTKKKRRTLSYPNKAMAEKGSDQAGDLTIRLITARARTEIIGIIV